MSSLAFEYPGTFWRGNIPTQSNLSYGCLDPGEVGRRYRDAGYDFLSLNDHFVGQCGYPVADTTGFRADDFTTILEAELHSGSMENGELWHIFPKCAHSYLQVAYR